MNSRTRVLRGGGEAMSARPRLRRLHRFLGLVLVLPILVWAATGFLFHLKPGWDAAYASLALPTRALEGTLAIPAGAGWLEVRGLRTSVGEHWLVRTPKGWQHLDASLQPFPEPEPARLLALLDEALAVDPERYGHVIGRLTEGERVTYVTSTDVSLELDWTTLGLSQRGPDTDRIDALYRVHYLQWTGIPAIDKPLALVGLAGLVGLALLGLCLVRGPGKAHE